MENLVRFLMLGLVTAGPAIFLTGVVIGVGKASSHLVSKWVTVNQTTPNLRKIKYISLFLGQCLGVWFFWSGFGIGMVASNIESSWVMTFAYLSLWITIPIVTVSYFLPLIGGFALIGNACWSFYLLNQIWLNTISLGEKDQIFLVKNDLYNLLLTQTSFSGPLLLLGIIFILIGWANLRKIYFMKKTVK